MPSPAPPVNAVGFLCAPLFLTDQVRLHVHAQAIHLQRTHHQAVEAAEDIDVAVSYTNCEVGIMFGPLIKFFCTGITEYKKKVLLLRVCGYARLAVHAIKSSRGPIG